MDNILLSIVKRCGHLSFGARVSLVNYPGVTSDEYVERVVDYGIPWRSWSGIRILDNDQWYVSCGQDTIGIVNNS